MRVAPLTPTDFPDALRASDAEGFDALVGKLVVLSTGSMRYAPRIRLATGLLPGFVGRTSDMLYV